ncbi:MAG: transcriptional regulator [Gemmatimonadetes bacterium]|nr:transcriptional regulator [Gemmatimonadota bacterium]
MNAPQRDADLSSLAVLGDATRRRLYHYVAARGGGVGRDEAARAAGISRMLAAFHLDKLVAAGLLVAEYRRLTGRRGPGAGRPSKLYRRSPRQITVMLPVRRYTDAARWFATAVEAAGPRATRALHQAVQAFGRDLGAAARELAGPRAGHHRLLAAAEQVLRDYGFAPARGNGDVLLHSCPFDALTQQHRDTVCHMNVELLSGFVRGLKLRGLQARRAPGAGRCCVILRGLKAHPPARG